VHAVVYWTVQAEVGQNIHARFLPPHLIRHSFSFHVLVYIYVLLSVCVPAHLWQSDWARTSAAKTATEAVEQIQADEIRLKLAEDSMRSVLNKVNRETEEVVKATQQLQKVQSELDNDFLYKLKSGGLIKQLSLVGLVLFSFRSLADTLAAVGGGGNNSGDDLTFALIQGAIALACALVFFVL
jgi:hypothetical protein